MARIGSKPIDELVRRAIIGDGMAFTALWDAYIDSLKSYIASNMHLRDDFLIDDICSRTFEKAFRSINSYDPTRSSFSTWLTTIAKNTTLDVLEGEKRLNRERVSLDTSPSAGSVMDTVMDQRETPLESIIRDEDESQTRKYIDALPELYREVARKRLVEGLQYKEIAEELNLELNTVRTRIRRAKEMIEKKKEDESDL